MDLVRLREELRDPPLCRSDVIPEKYPRQPVVSCAGYKPTSEAIAAGG